MPPCISLQVISTQKFTQKSVRTSNEWGDYMNSTLADLLADRFNRMGDKTAIILPGESGPLATVTFSELDAYATRAANFFLEQGIQRGDRIILYTPKCMAQVTAHIGAQKIGAVSVPLNPGFTRSEMTYYLTDSGAKMAVAGRSEAAVIEAIEPELPIVTVNPDEPQHWKKCFPGEDTPLPAADVDAGDPAMIIYTSGTTGQPKGAVLTQANLIHDVRNILKIWEITDADVLCHALPLFHIHGLCFALHTALAAGATVILLDAFRPKQVVDVLSRKDGALSCTVFMAVPTMYNRLFGALSGELPDFSHLRLLTSGSAPLRPKDFHRIKEIFGKEPVEREGMSETGMNFSNPLNGKRKPGTIGLPLPGLEVRIVDPIELTEVAAGETGEIWLKGPGITPGYWGKKEETEKAFVNGWFRTGDLGKIDEDGYYCITDRLKHIIITGGENVSPKEIESVINQHDAVSESCVVGVPDEKWGEIIAAAIRLQPHATATDHQIKDHCKQHLLSWKCPKTILFVDEIPRNTMGKVLKEGVKRLFQN